MAPVQTPHPTPDELAAFGLGKLDPEESAAIERHIAQCDSCCQALKEIPDDTLVGLLRDNDTRSEFGNADGGQGRGTATAETAFQSGRDDSDQVDAFEAESNGLDSADSEEPGSVSMVGDIPEQLANHPRYHVERLLGKGGMGDVYQAQHRLMERTVAIKVINPEIVQRPEAVRRFQREVKAAARLSHPNIVAAYDAEEAGDLHILVMEYVEGRDLACVVKDSGPLSVADACQFVAQAARGLQHAHDGGMVHRDIKPQNLMLTPTGEVKILDFGLAQFAREAVVPGRPGDGPGELTDAHSMMGTPDYMAPEQAQSAHNTDIRADIYGLGATLYFLLAGKPPFAGDSLLKKLKGHAKDDLPPLAEVRDDVPPELEAVLRRMMAKDPAERYQTPDEVVEVLAPSAQPTAPVAQPGPRRWFVRPAVLVGLAAAAVLAFAGIFTVVTNRGDLEIRTFDEDVEVSILKGGREVTILDTKTDNKLTLYAGEYELKLSGEKGDLQLSTNTFTLRRGEKVIVEVRRVETSPANVPVVATEPGATDAPAEPADMQSIFNGKDLTGWDGDPRLWSVRDGAIRGETTAENPAQDNTFLIWKEGATKDFQLRLSFRCTATNNSGIQYRSKHVTEGRVRNPWVVRGYQYEIRNEVELPSVAGFIFDEGGRRGHMCLVGEKATWGEDGKKRVTDTLIDPKGYPKLFKLDDWNDVVIVARGNHLQHYLNNRLILDCTDNHPQLALREGILALQLHAGTPMWVEFKNIRIKHGSEKVSGTISDIPAEPVPPAVTVQLRARLLGHSADVRSMAVSPQGKTLATASFDGTVKLWDIASRKELATLRGHTGKVNCVVFSSDGKTLASAGFGDKVVKLWDATTRKELSTLEGHTSGVVSTAFAPDGSTVASADWGGTVKAWDVAKGTELATLKGHIKQVEVVAFSPDGKLLISGSWDGTVKFWDVGTWKEQATLRVDTGVRSVVFSPDGKTLATGSKGGTVKLWDVATRKARTGWQAHAQEVRALAFAPDGKTLASSSPDGTFKIWDASTGELLASYQESRKLWSIAFSRDGLTLLTAGSDGTVKLWDVASLPLADPAPTEKALPNGWVIHQPVNLGPSVNSRFEDGTPALSADGRTLLFHSNRPGGQGDADLWMCIRASASEPFAEPANLGSTVNSRFDDIHPTLSADGLTLLFGSDRPGGKGSQDLWMCQRAAPGEPFGKPVNLGPTVNSTLRENSPALSTDGLTLVFQLSRPGDRDADLWMSTRAQPGEPFGKPVNLGETVNSSAKEIDPALSADGLTLLFCSVRPGGQGDHDLWMSVRTSASEAFGEPVNLGPTVNSRFPDGSPTLSADGRTLLFDSLRPGGQGDRDLWTARIEAGAEETVLPKPKAMLEGHADCVRFVAFSPDGKTLATATEEGTVKLWDASQWTSAAAITARAVEFEELIGRLKHDASQVRAEAALKLGELGDKRGVEPLIAALGDEDKWVRGRAASALGNLGEKRAVEPLIDTLGDEDRWVGGMAATALGNLGDQRAVEPLRAVLTDERGTVMTAGAVALAQLLDDERAVEPLIAAIRQGDNCMGSLVIGGTLLQIGQPAVEPLTAALKDENFKVRSFAAGVLGMLGDQRAVEPLMAILEEMAWDLEIARRLEAEAAEPMPEAVTRRVRRRAASALDALVSIGPPAFEPLVAALKDERASMRSLAAQGLGKIGPEAEEAIPELINTLKHEDEEDKKGQLNLVAAEALGEIGTAAVPELRRLLRDGNSIVKMSAAYALEKMGPEAREAMPELIEALGDEYKYTSATAAAALGAIGPAAIPELKSVLADEDEQIRALAAGALGEIGASAVPLLIEALADPHAVVRGRAAMALTLIGPEAKDAIPALEKMLNDEASSPRQMAAQALERIRTKP